MAMQHMTASPTAMAGLDADYANPLARSSASTPPGRAWVTALGASQTLQGSTSLGEAKTSDQDYGIAVGGDYRVAPHVVLGAALTGVSAQDKVGTLATSGKTETVAAGVYGIGWSGDWYGLFDLAYGGHHNTTHRMVDTLGLMETESGSFDGHSLSGDFETGYAFRSQAATLKPFVAVDVVELWEDGFNETSKGSGGQPGALGMSFAAQQTQSVQSQLGARIEGRADLAGGAVFLPYLKASWAHEFDPARQTSTGFEAAPGFSFINDGAQEFHDAAKIDAGGVVRLKTGLGIFARVTTTLSDRDTTVEGNAGVNMRW
jgi:outer membrane autotransporter protein